MFYQPCGTDMEPDWYCVLVNEIQEYCMSEYKIYKCVLNLRLSSQYKLVHIVQ